MHQVAPLIGGLAVALAAYAGKHGIKAWNAFKARPAGARRFYDGGFQDPMTRREAALILGIRGSTPADKVKEAYTKVILANHPDKGGSKYLFRKVTDARDLLLGKTKGGSSAF